MKRKFCGLLCLCMLCTSLLTGVSAAEPAKAQIDYTPESFSQTFEWQDDGSFVITTVRKLDKPSVLSTVSADEDAEYYASEVRTVDNGYIFSSAANGSYVASKIEYTSSGTTWNVFKLSSFWQIANNTGTFQNKYAGYYGKISGDMPSTSGGTSYKNVNVTLYPGESLTLETEADYRAPSYTEALRAEAKIQR